MSRRILVALTALALFGCELKAAPPRAPAPAALVVGVFSGTLPCADCSGLDTRLTLTRKGPGSAEGGYQLVETYQGKSGPRTTQGRWTTLRGSAADPDTIVYQLDPDQPDHSRYFQKVGEDAIQVLGRDLKPIDTPFNMTLKKTG